MAKLTIEAIRERFEQTWKELIDYYDITEDRAERCANQDLLDRRWLIAEIQRIKSGIKETDAFCAAPEK